MQEILVCKEQDPRETRVPLVPDDIRALTRMGFKVKAVSGTGIRSGYPDVLYRDAGAELVSKEDSASDIVLRIQKPRSVKGLKAGCIHISFLDPYTEKPLIKEAADKKIQLVSLNLIPRTSVAQKMDAQSSQSSLGGYVALIKAASRLSKALPMMMTPAGTINPARVLIIGAGVAGLQAIATAKRLGARVYASDIRPETMEQMRSLGAVPVRTASEQVKACERSDIIITTARGNGGKAPVIVTKDTIARMQPGSVIVDMAVRNGGNVEGSKPDEEMLTDNGVLILSGDQLEREVAKDASKMLSGNITAFLSHFRGGEGLRMDPAEEIMKDCLLTKDGRVIHPLFQRV